MEQLKNLPIGIQDFEKLRTDNYLYIDKTAIIYKMVSTGSYYFLSRPRRFGKSMLISTLKAYFLGKKDLFTGLAVEQLEQKWTVHPVLHLDLNTAKYIEKGALDDVINNALPALEGPAAGSFWFQTGGGGTQYMFNLSIEQLINKGYLVPIY